MRCGVLLCCLVWFAVARAGAQEDVAALWQELSQRYTEKDLPGALLVTDRLVTALEPRATDFSDGILLNSARHNRASLRFNLGDFLGAEQDLLQSVEQAKAIQPPPGMPAVALPQMMEMVHDRVRSSLRGLVNFYLAASDLEKATLAFREAIQIQPLWKQQQARDPSYGYQALAAESSSLEGTFYRKTGDYAKAVEAYLTQVEELEKAWQSVEQVHGGKLPEVAEQLRMNYYRTRSHSLMELAEIASLQGRHEEALGFCEQARTDAIALLPLYRSWAETAAQTSGVAPAVIEATLRNVEISTQYLLYERAARVFRAAGREKAALDAMNEALAARGDFQKAQRMLTLEYNVMLPEESLQLLGDLQALLGQYDEAEATYEKATGLVREQYPVGHPSLLAIQESQALLAHVRGDQEKAREVAAGVFEARMEDLEAVLAFADESQRLSYRSTVDLWSLQASLDMAEALAGVVLRGKGIVLESLLEDRGLADKITDPELVQVLENIQVDRRKLMEALMGAGTTSAGEIERLKARLAEQEQKLRGDGAGRPGAREAVRIEVQDVVARLPEGAALLEYIRYERYTAPGRSQTHYGALVLRAGAETQFVDLGEAEPVDEAITLYSRAVREVVPAEEMQKILRFLGTRLWHPLVEHLPGPGATVVVSPDADLNFLSFATLLTGEEAFVGEVWPIVYVTSGRDLLREQDSTRSKEIEMIANPDFQTPATDKVAVDRHAGTGAVVAMRGVLDRIGLSPLPGTEAEEKMLRELVTTQWGWTMRSHLGHQATEAAVHAVRSPAILHFATHGFYLPRTGQQDSFVRARPYWDRQTPGGGQGAVAEVFSDVVLNHPMHRSGIALSGAEATLQHWGAGRVLETANDGILTAEEMSRLSLQGTWLVVLSACETGLGESRSGEGVLGMRRGLIQAGAQNLLLTLWPVADRETALFMLDFYSGLEAGEKSPAQVCPRVQAEYLKKFREEQGIAAAVRLAGAFILSGQGDF